MRLLVVGNLDVHMVSAVKIAIYHQAQILHVNDIEEALQMLRSTQDLQLAIVHTDLNVLGFMKSLQNEDIVIPVICCGVISDSDYATKIMKTGVMDCIGLSAGVEKIGDILKKVMRSDKEIVSCDPNYQRILNMAEKVAQSEATILVTGESGTGKEVLSKFIHSMSKRSDKTFVSVNCAAIPESLLESELFGYEKGAFTGAMARRMGKFEQANGGTLLLDEISEMSTALQAKLLRAIQEREIDRLGGIEKVKVDIRLIATSNQNLKESLSQGKFREDLYYRLNVINLHIPPLRQRTQDILKLCEYFIKKYCDLNKIPMRSLSAESRNLLQKYLWPGNVRELENTIHRAILMAVSEIINPEDLQIQNHMRVAK